MNKDCRGYYSVFIRRGNAPKYLFKLFPHEWISLSTQKQKELIIDELLYWDGNSVPNRNQIEYSSKEISNCTFIQTISSLCGYCATIISISNQFGKWFKVSILFSKSSTDVQSLYKNKKNIPYDGFVYCATVPSGMLIVRQNNCISISGNCDALSMHEAGIYNSVSVPNGASNNTKYIDNCYEFFLNKKKIIIATDNDDAGRKLRDELMFRFGVDRCYFVQFPDDCKDANDVLVKYGKEELKKIVENAIQIPIEGLVSDKERMERMLDLYENGMPKGTPAGIYGFDDYLRFQGGLVTTITAPPSTGKSEFLDYIISGLATKENWRFGVFSFENQPIELHDAKWAEKIVGKAFAFRKDPNNRISKQALDAVLNEIFDKFKVIEVTKIDKSVDGVLAKAEELVNKYGIKGVVIDPYNKMLHNVPAGMTETNYINLVMTKITDFAKKYNIHVFLVVHPTKPQGANSATPQRVTLYNASGSANFYNQTDNGFTLMRNRDTGVVDVYIEKVRFSEQGKEGWVAFTFNTLTRQYIYHSSKDPVVNEQPQTVQTRLNYDDNDSYAEVDGDTIPF
jgi:twinkle protein